MKKKLIVSVLFIAGLSLAVKAGAITWDDLLEEAMRNSPEIINARNELQQSQISYRSSLLNYLPGISGSAGARRSDSGNTSYSMSLNGSLSLFKGFQNSLQVKSSRTGLSIQQALCMKSLSDFIYELRESFAGLLKAEKTLDILRDIEKRRKNNLDLVELRYDAGREDKGAYLRSEADYLQAQYETRSQERNLRVVQAQLLRNMGRDPGYGVVEVTGTFDVPSVNEEPSEDLLHATPDYIIAQYRLKAAEYDLKYQYGDIYPDLGLSGSVSRSGSSWPPDSESYGIGLSLSYPFFARGRDIYDIKSARLDRNIAENNLADAGRQIMVELESAYNGFIDSREFYEVRKKYYHASRESAEISREKYINGLMSYEDWDTIENQYISARKSLLDAQYGVFTAWAKWVNSTGRVMQDGYVPGFRQFIQEDQK